MVVAATDADDDDDDWWRGSDKYKLAKTVIRVGGFVCSEASVVCWKKKESEINGFDYPITRWNNDDFNSHCCSI